MMKLAPRWRSCLAALALLPGMLTGGCGNASSKGDPRKALQQLFFYYQVDGREEEELVTVKLQFQEGGLEADAVHPGLEYAVSIDGQALRADTSRFSGVYFEYQAPLDSFSGRHKVEISQDGQTLRADTFDFYPLSFREAFPDSISRRGFSLTLAGLEPGEALRVVISDTSFGGDGLNRLYPQQQGKVKVEGEDLQNLAHGLLSVELIREWERPLAETPGAGGLFRLNYLLRRECYLTD